MELRSETVASGLIAAIISAIIAAKIKLQNFVIAGIVFDAGSEGCWKHVNQLQLTPDRSASSTVAELALIVREFPKLRRLDVTYGIGQGNEQKIKFDSESFQTVSQRWLGRNNSARFYIGLDERGYQLDIPVDMAKLFENDIIIAETF